MKNNKSTKKVSEEEIIKNTNDAKRDMFLEYVPYLIIIFFVVIIRIFIATPVNVNGSSMNPTLKNGDIMLLYKLKMKLKGLNRFDIVVVETDSAKLIKRIIGMPGDKIRYEVKEDKEEEKMVATLYINDKKVDEKFLSEDAKNSTCQIDWQLCQEEQTVPEGEYFVMGDNRGDSTDSRMIGTVKEEDILGITELRLFPFNKFGNVK